MKVINLSQNNFTKVPAFAYRIETADLKQNQITDWNLEPSIDYSLMKVRNLDVSENLWLGLPPADFLRESLVNKLVLTGCNVDRTMLMRQMDKNGVKEYQERHKRKLDQAVHQTLHNDYRLFGLADK